MRQWYRKGANGLSAVSTDARIAPKIVSPCINDILTSPSRSS